ncbi:MAG: sensor histidine kinase, partial [Clostridia bacterium]|nr:sensor histidine kinase [Clostridia bacterium]
IVENSVLHGINGNTNGCITISGRIKGGKAIFKIRDNGVGFDMNEKNSLDCRESESNTHIGIKNTDLRIKIFYGSESGISVESCPGNGCEITVVIQLGNNT